jgi:hypothetical protein
MFSFCYPILTCIHISNSNIILSFHFNCTLNSHSQVILYFHIFFILHSKILFIFILKFNPYIYFILVFLFISFIMISFNSDNTLPTFIHTTSSFGGLRFVVWRQTNPFCDSRSMHYCEVHKSPRSALTSCPLYKCLPPTIGVKVNIQKDLYVYRTRVSCDM